MNVNDIKNMSFEDALKRLEENVQSLEKGDLDLEESIKIYEEGTAYSVYCMQKLDAAEKKIEELKNKKNGAFQTKPLDLSNNKSSE